MVKLPDPWLHAKYPDVRIGLCCSARNIFLDFPIWKIYIHLGFGIYQCYQVYTALKTWTISIKVSSIMIPIFLTNILKKPSSSSFLFKSVTSAMVLIGRLQSSGKSHVPSVICTASRRCWSMKLMITEIFTIYSHKLRWQDICVIILNIAYYETSSL